MFPPADFVLRNIKVMFGQIAGQSGPNFLEIPYPEHPCTSMMNDFVEPAVQLQEEGKGKKLLFFALFSTLSSILYSSFGENSGEIQRQIQSPSCFFVGQIAVVLSPFRRRYIFHPLKSPPPPKKTPKKTGEAHKSNFP